MSCLEAQICVISSNDKQVFRKMPLRKLSLKLEEDHN